MWDCGAYGISSYVVRGTDKGKEGYDMTLIKERAIKMIERMPEDNMLYVINILQNLEAMSADKEKDRKRARAALAEILDMEKRLPEDFDPEKELWEAREERYGNLS